MSGVDMDLEKPSPSGGVDKKDDHKEDGSFRGRGGRGGPFRGRGRGDFNNRGRGFDPSRGRGGSFRGRGGHDEDRQGPGDRGGFFRGGRGGRGGGRGGYDRVRDRLQNLQNQNMADLEPLDTSEKRFNGRARLYLGNLPPDTTENSLKELMAPFGEIGQVFLNNEKNFAFLRLPSKVEAEKAKRDLDGHMINGRPMKVRFAPHQGCLKVSNLGPFVSNELLHRAFSVFGDIERCMVHVDDRGKSKGTGFVEFEKKPNALEAARRCQEGCFFLTSALRPVIVEILEETEDDDGLIEKNLPRHRPDFQAEREHPPRFADDGSYAHAYGQKWKSLYEMKKSKMESLEREIRLEEEKLVAEMEFVRFEQETEHLRNQLRAREANLDHHKSQWEDRERQMTEQLRAEQERRTNDESMLSNRMQEQDNAMRQRQQENSLFMQAQELNNMLDQERGPPQRMGGASPWANGSMNKGGFGNNFGGRGGGFSGGDDFNNFNGGGPRRGGGNGPPGWGNEMGGPGIKRRRF